MTYTSSEANKLLKEKNEEYTALLRKTSRSSMKPCGAVWSNM